MRLPIRWIRPLLLLALPTAAWVGGLPAQMHVELPPLPGPTASRCGSWLLGGDPVVARIRLALATEEPEAVLRTLDAMEPGIRREVAERPDDSAALYRLVSVLGARADRVPGRGALEVADELYLRVADLLEREPDHAGAHHILGRLHAAGMRMGGLERFLARTLLGADLLGDLSWSDARIHLERAERLDPCVPDHHYELAKLYSERGDARAALEEIEHVLVLGAQAPVPTDVLDKTASLRDLLASR